MNKQQNINFTMDKKIISKIDETKSVEIAQEIISRVENTKLEDIATVLNGITIALVSICSDVKKYVDGDKTEELIMTWFAACDGLKKTNFSKFIKLPEEKQHSGDIHDETDVMPTRE